MPLSAALLSERLDEVFVKFRQQVDAVVDSVGAASLSPHSFEELSASLRNATAEAGLALLVKVVEAADVSARTIEKDGRSLRFRGQSPKQWLTRFGIATVKRRYYASDEGEGCVVPLDALCGMTERFMTPDVEEMVAFACSAMTPCEVEQILKKALPAAPSATAIKRTIRDVGGYLEEHREQVEEVVQSKAPLNDEGPCLVVSWDGVMVPLRGAKETNWKEAGVGRVSIYSDPDESDGRLRLLDSRCYARMPEPGMQTLIGDVAAAVAEVRAQQTFARVAVICDGKESIWKAAKKCPQLDGATLILDFYHASQTLAGTANAIFGDETLEARKWHEARREQMLLDHEAVPKLLRTLRRHLRKLSPKTAAYDVVRRAIAHFKTNRLRMRYAEFIEHGFPIGSGHIESAAKFLVTQRLKRSGMRWSRVGAQQVLNIRTRVKEGRWDAAWGAYMDGRAAA